MAQQRIHQVTRALLDTVRLLLKWDRYTAEGLDDQSGSDKSPRMPLIIPALRTDSSSASGGTADEGHDLVFPIDFGKRFRAPGNGEHIGIEGMVQKKLAVVDS